MTSLLWIVALLLVGLALLVLEVFVPSGGVLGFLSVVAIGAGIVIAFVEQGAWAGVTAMAAAGVAVPAALAVAFHWFPQTPLGRRVIPAPPAADDVVPDNDRRQRLRGLVGRRGRTTTELLPWGGVTLDGHEIDALSDGGPLDRDTEVEVIGVQGLAVVVRTPRPGVPPAPLAGDAVARPAVREEAGRAVVSPLEETLAGFDFDALARGAGRSGEPLDSGSPPNES